MPEVWGQIPSDKPVSCKEKKDFDKYKWVTEVVSSVTTLSESIISKSSSWYESYNYDLTHPSPPVLEQRYMLLYWTILPYLYTSTLSALLPSALRPSNTFIPHLHDCFLFSSPYAALLGHPCAAAFQVQVNANISRHIVNIRLFISIFFT